MYFAKLALIVLSLSNLAFASNHSANCGEVPLSGACYRFFPWDPIVCLYQGDLPKCPPGCVRVDPVVYENCTGKPEGTSCTNYLQCIPRWITELPF